jgi:membrane protein
MEKLNQMTHGWAGLLAAAARQALNSDSSMAAAAIAYFALFSLFPITILSISVASLTLGPLVDQQVILQKLEFVTPAISQLLGQNFNQIIHDRGSVSWVALIGLIWSASTVFYMLSQTLNEIWDGERRRPVWEGRGLAILFVLMLVGPMLFLASILSSFISNIGTWLPALGTPVLSVISFLVATLLDIALLFLLYMLLPHGTATRQGIIPGAIAAGILWELAKRAFLLIVSTYVSISNLVYGSVSAIIAFLIWAYLSGQIFLFGAFLNVAYYRKGLPPAPSQADQSKLIPGPDPIKEYD